MPRDKHFQFVQSMSLPAQPLTIIYKVQTVFGARHNHFHNAVKVLLYLWICQALGGAQGKSDKLCSPCPQHCDCRQSLPEHCIVDCQDVSLGAIPPRSTLPPAEFFTHLIFSNCSLRNISAGDFVGLVNIVELDLTQNYITSLDVDVFQPLTNLEILHLQGNSLTYLPRQIFNGRSNLKELYINEMNLFTIDEVTFAPLSGLKKISFGGNPLFCDCRLTWLKLWMEEKREGEIQISDLDQVVCVSPHSLKGKSLIEINVTKLSCDPQDYFSCVPSVGPSRNIPIIFTSALTSGASQLSCHQHCFVQGFHYGWHYDPGVCLCGENSQVLLQSCACPVHFTKVVLSSWGRYNVCPLYYLQDVFHVNAHIVVDGVRPYSTLEDVKLTIQTNLSVSSYQWDFGDATDAVTVVVPTVIHHFTLAGQYQVTVTVNAGQGSHTSTVVLLVQDPIAGVHLMAPRYHDVTRRLDMKLRLLQGSQVSVRFSRETVQHRYVWGRRCAQGWVQFGSRCLVPSGDSLTDFKTAQLACAQRRASLLRFSSKDEIEAITAQLQIGATPHFTDAYQEDDGDAYVWKSTNRSAPPFLNATSVFGAEVGKCLVVMENKAPQGTHCSLLHNYICQQGPVDCIHGGKAVDPHTCYNLYQSNTTWLEAEEMCNQLQGHLVTADRMQLESHIINLVPNKSSAEEFWIGLNPNTSTDGESAHTSSTAPGRTSGQQCTRMVWDGGQWHWRPGPCDQQLPYMCQYPAGAFEQQVPKLIAGSPVMGSIEQPMNVLTLMQETDTSQMNKQLIFPGLWFSHVGYLQAWHFTALVQEDTVLRLQVLRPQCPPEEYLVPPGCDARPSPFTVCSSEEVTSCSWLAASDCPHGQQYCPLLQDCLNLLEPCNCNNITHPSCELDDSSRGQRYAGSKPAYQIISNSEVLVPSDPVLRVYLVPVSGIQVHPGDIISVVYSSGEPPINCVTVANSVLRQSINLGNYDQQMSISNESDMWMDNTVCLIHALYTASSAVLPPENIVHPRGFKVGTFSFRASLRNSVSDKEVERVVTMQAPITRLHLAVPAVQHPAVNPGSVGLAAVEAGVPQMLTWAIRRGTNVTAQCSLSKDQIMDFSAGSSTIQYKFNVGDLIRVNVTANNMVSQAVYTVDVFAQEKITGLRIDKPLPLYYQSSSDLLYNVSTVTGSHVKYLWKFGDGASETTNAPVVSHSYPSAGKYKMHVQAFNLISSMEVFADILLLNKANVVHVGFASSSQLTALTGEELLLTVTVDLAPMSMIQLTVDFGDALPVVTLVEMITSTPYQKDFVHTYSSGGNFDITVDVVDAVLARKEQPLGEGIAAVQARNTVEVVRRVAGVTLQVDGRASAVATHTAVQFVAQFLSGTGHIVFMWDFGDGSKQNETQSVVVKNEYMTSGTYTVTVTISNGASWETASVQVVVEEPVSGLHLSYDGPTSYGQNTTLTAQIFSGSNVQYSFQSGKHNMTWTLPSDSLTEIFTYLNPGVYTARVNASNSVGHETAELEVFVITEQSLYVTGLQHAECVELQSQVRFTVQVIHIDPQSLQYFWDFGDSSTDSGLGKKSVVHSYLTVGTYVVEVLVIGTFKSDMSNSSICVQEAVGQVDILAPNILALNGTNSVTSHINVTVSGGTDYNIFMTSSRQLIQQRITNASYEVKFTEAGQYLLTFTVSNTVSKVFRQISVQVQEIIHGLYINYSTPLPTVEGYVAVSVLYSFHVHTSSGTNMTYTWNHSSSDVYQSQHSNISLQFGQVGSHFVGVTVQNDVSIEQSNIQVIAEEMIKHLVMTASEYDPEPGRAVSIQASVVSGREILFEWKVCQEVVCHSVPETGSEIIHIFPEGGIHVVTVTASNNINSVMNEIFIYVMEPITKLRIVVVNLTVPAYMEVGKLLEISFDMQAGVLVGTEWILHINGELYPVVGSDTWQLNCSIVGFYEVKLIASNRVSKAEDTLTFEIQEPITGLYILATNGTKIHPNVDAYFEAMHSRGTGLKYNWTIVGGDALVNNHNKLLLYRPQAEEVVTLELVASNGLGRQTASLTLTVQELIDEEEIEINVDTAPFVSLGERIQFSPRFNHQPQFDYQWGVTSIQRIRPPNAKEFFYTFVDVGSFVVSLKVLSGTAFVEANTIVKVQERVASLTLEASDTTVAVNQTIVVTAIVTQGSDLEYVWFVCANEDKVMSHGRQSHFRFSSSIGGDFQINAMVKNNVSMENQTVDIEVVEEIHGLEMQVVDFAQVFEIVVARANVSSGTSVRYTWAIDPVVCGICPPEVESSLLTIMFFNESVYNLSLTAKNAISYQQVFNIITVHKRMGNLSLEGPGEVYQGERARYHAVVSGGSPTDYKWRINFGSIIETMENFLDINFTDASSFYINVQAINKISKVTASKMVTVVSLRCQPPVLHAVGAQVLLRSRDLKLEVPIDINCTWYPLVFNWQIFMDECSEDTAEQDQIKPPQGTATSFSLLNIPQRSLARGDYCFVFTVEYQQTPMKLTSKIDVSIVPTQLIGIIEGGTRRTFSTDQVITLNASQSYDPDREPGDVGHLSYEWTCTTHKLDGTTSSDSSFCDNWVEYAKVVIIPKDTLKAGHMYNVSLQVTSPGCLNSTTTQENCPSGVRVEYKWTVTRDDEEQLPLNQSTTTTGADKQNLVVKQGWFAISHDYRFRLEIRMPQILGLSGFSILDLPANQPPTGGFCVVQPQRVVALTIPVVVECQDWKDADGSIHSPLEYQVTAENLGEERQVLSSYPLYGGQRYVGSYYLSPWSADLNRIRIIVQVADDDGGSTLANITEVVVEMPSVVSPEYLFNEMKHVIILLMMNNPLATPMSIAYTMLLNALSENPDIPEFDLLSEFRLLLLKDFLHHTSIDFNSFTHLHQVTYELLLLTMFITDDLVSQEIYEDLVDMLEQIIIYLQMNASPASVTDKSLPTHVITITANMLEAGNKFISDNTNVTLNKTSWMQDMTIRLVHLVENTMVMVLSTNILSEEGSKYETSYLSAKCQRVVTSEIWTDVESLGLRITFPSSLLAEHSDAEVFQMFTSIPTGLTNNTTSKLVGKSFKFSNGSDLSVQGLPPGQHIKIWLPRQDTVAKISHNNSDEWSQSSGSLTLRRFPQISVLHLGPLLQTGAVHIYIEVELNTSLTGGKIHQQAEDNVLLIAYLAQGYEPFYYQYDQIKIISKSDVEDPHKKKYTFFLSKNEGVVPDRPFYLTLSNCNPDGELNVSVHTYLSECKFYEADSKAWKVTGCIPLEEATPDLTVCECNHLTLFGATIRRDPLHVDFVNFRYLDFAHNPVVIVTVSLIAALYLVLVVIARRADLHEYRQIHAVPLCGRGGSFMYEITIVTGRNVSAGTSANVGLKLHGELSNSRAVHLEKPGAFQRNCCDLFLIATESSLGELQYARLWHDNTGTHAAWQVVQLSVRDLHTSKRWVFLLNKWLSLSSPDATVEVEVKPATVEELTKFKTVLRGETSQGFAERHVWLSVVNCSRGSSYTRVQRVTCCVTLLYSYLCANVVWYAILAPPTELSYVLGLVRLSWPDLLVGVMSSLTVIPINLLIIQIFRSSQPKMRFEGELSKPGTAETVEMDAMCDVSNPGDSFCIVSGESLPLSSPVYSEDSVLQESRTQPSNGLHRSKVLSRLALGHMDEARDDTDLDSNSSTTQYRGSCAHKGGGQEEGTAWWSNDSILRWPEHLPAWKEQSRHSSATSSVQPTQYSQGPEKETQITDVECKEEQDMSNTNNNSKTWDDSSSDVSAEVLPMQTLHQQHTVSTVQQEQLSLGDISDGFASQSRHVSLLEAYGQDVQLHQTPAPGQHLLVTKVSHSNPQDTASLEPNLHNILKEIDENMNDGNTPQSGTSDVDPVTQQISRQTSSKTQTQMSKRWAQIVIPPELSHYHQESITESESASPSPQLHPPHTENNLFPAVSGLTKQSGAGETRLPAWCSVVAYLLCLLLSGVCVVVVLLYGQAFGQQQSLKWLLACFTSFLYSAFILEPFRVFVMAVFLALVASHNLRLNRENGSLSHQPPHHINQNEKIKEPRVRPPRGFALLQAREESRRLGRMYAILRQGVIYSLVVALVWLMAYTTQSDLTYYMTWASRHTFLESTESNMTQFIDINSVDAWWHYMNTTLTFGIHPNDTQPSEGYILGVVQLRQIRSVPMKCPVEKSLLKTAISHVVIRTCSGNPGWQEDQSPHLPVENDSYVGNLSWNFSPEEITNIGSFTGYVGTYGGGGYVHLLGFTAYETAAKLRNLHRLNWIDRHTRAVFVELTVYNANIDHFAAITLLTEFPVSGGALPTAQVQVFQSLRWIQPFVDLLLAMKVALLCLLVYLCVVLFSRWRRQGWMYLVSCWNLVEVTIAALIGASLGLYIQRVVTDTMAHEAYLHNRTGFTSMWWPAYYNQQWRQVTSSLVFLLTVWIARQLRFVKRLYVYGHSLRLACPRIAGIALLLALAGLAYSQLGYLWYGNMVTTFRSVGASIMQVVCLPLGGAGNSLDAMHTESKTFTTLYVFSWLAMALLAGTALAVAVLADVYKVSRMQTRFHNSMEMQDYEMIDVMVKRLKKVLKLTKTKPAFRRVKFQGLSSLPSRGSSSFCASSFVSSTGGSGLSALEGEPSKLYLESLLDRVVPTWRSLLDKLEQVEFLELKEQEQLETLGQHLGVVTGSDSMEAMNSVIEPVPSTSASHQVQIHHDLVPRRGHLGTRLPALPLKHNKLYSSSKLPVCVLGKSPCKGIGKSSTNKLGIKSGQKSVSQRQKPQKPASASQIIKFHDEASDTDYSKPCMQTSPRVECLYGGNEANYVQTKMSMSSKTDVCQTPNSPDHSQQQ